jgi:integrase
MELRFKLRFALRFVSAAHWRAAISSSARRFASIRRWEYRESITRETWPPMPMISERLGHSSVATTPAIYSHAIRGKDRVAAQVACACNYYF